MHESISYSFLLNIVILFVFVCGAIIGGIFSYYRAFRANTIIVNEIEKYEGYNCKSKESIAKKLQSITYNVPFNVKCKSSEPNCITDNDENGNYAVVSYNLDYNDGSYAYGEVMNSKVSTDGSYTERYQYGVYTYMYVDLPVVSQILRIPFYSKTKVLHEFRHLVKTDLFGTYDLNIIPSDIKGDFSVTQYTTEFSKRGLKNYQRKKMQNKYLYGYDPDIWGHGKNIIDSNYDLRDAFRYYFASLSASASQVMYSQGRLKCEEYIADWSIY